MAKPFRPEAENFQKFKEAIRDELKDKDPGTEWAVRIEVKKVGNPIHEYRIVLSPLG